MSSPRTKLVYGTVPGGDGTPVEESRPRLSFAAAAGDGVQTYQATLVRKFACPPAAAEKIAAGWTPDETIIAAGTNYGSGWRITSSDADLDGGTATLTAVRDGVTPFEIGLPTPLTVTWNAARTTATIANANTAASTTVSASGSTRGFWFDYTPAAKPAADASGGLLDTLRNCKLWCGKNAIATVDVGALFAIGAVGSFLEKVTTTETLAVEWTPVRKYGDWYVATVGSTPLRDAYDALGRAAVDEAAAAKYATRINRILDASGATGLTAWTCTYPTLPWNDSWNIGTRTYTSTVTLESYQVTAAGLSHIADASTCGPRWHPNPNGTYSLKYFGQTLYTSP